MSDVKAQPVVKTAAKIPSIAEPTPGEGGVKLWSPRGNMENGSTHISLTSGHTFLVPHDKAGVSVPKKFRREAIAKGCLPVGMEEEIDESQGFDRSKVIRSNLEQMLESTEDGMFTTDGKPVLQRLAAMCGFQLDRSEVNRVWDDMHKDADDDAPTVVSVGSA